MDGSTAPDRPLLLPGSVMMLLPMRWQTLAPWPFYAAMLVCAYFNWPQPVLAHPLTLASIGCAAIGTALVIRNAR